MEHVFQRHLNFGMGWGQDSVDDTVGGRVGQGVRDRVGRLGVWKGRAGRFVVRVGWCMVGCEYGRV